MIQLEQKDIQLFPIDNTLHTNFGIEFIDKKSAGCISTRTIHIHNATILPQFGT